MRPRLHAVVAVALVLALATATGSLLASSLGTHGTSAPGAASAFVADDLDGAVGVISPPLLVVPFLLVLAVVCLVGTSSAGAVPGGPRHARAPPSP